MTVRGLFDARAATAALVLLTTTSVAMAGTAASPATGSGAATACEVQGTSFAAEKARLEAELAAIRAERDELRRRLGTTGTAGAVLGQVEATLDRAATETRAFAVEANRRLLMTVAGWKQRLTAGAGATRQARQ